MRLTIFCCNSKPSTYNLQPPQLPDEKQHKTETPAEQNNKPEVRYVPIEYLPEMHNDDDEIDLLELGRKIWDGRKTIIKITAAFIVFGVFWALFSPVEYESEAILMPEAQAPQEGRAGQLLRDVLLRGATRSVEERLEALARPSLDDVNAALAAVPLASPTRVVLGPERGR